jgi:3-hydroxybutyryl-CoA dehydrogenase
MIVAILADDEIKAEITGKGYSNAVEIIWADSVQSLRIIEADAYFDLLFENDKERIARLKFLLPKPLFVNAVIPTGRELPEGFIRINAWPTMIKRDLVELATIESSSRKKVKNVFDEMGWTFQEVPDVPGMITPRIIAMIINEAWFSIAENVSSREEIDTAMKLGTNYPYGPFEWGDKIGLGRIADLLNELQKTDGRYSIAPGLAGEFKWR